MNYDQESRSLAFVISSLAIGGPQKSLIGLLQRLEPDRFDVSVVVLNGETGALTEALPANVNLVFPPKILAAAMLPRKKGLLAASQLICHLLRRGRARLAARLVLLLIWSAISRSPGQQVRQRTWELVGGSLPKLPGSFDFGVGILGLSTYVVVDSLDATFKYHWVRSDSRILGRDERIERQYFSKLNGALSVSQACSEIFVGMYPFMDGRTLTYKNDIPALSGDESVEWPATRESALKLLTVARLDPLKGLDLALEAAEHLGNRGLEFSWVILGDGPERKPLQEMIDARGLGDTFILAGSVLDTSVYLTNADIYVHPSRTEGRSNAVEEARASGVPILATAYPTVADQVRSKVDGLVCEMSGQAIADGIEYLSTHSGEAHKYASNARAAYLKEQSDPNQVLYQLSSKEAAPQPPP